MHTTYLGEFLDTQVSKPIEQKLLVAILFASFVITTISTGIIFFLDFNVEITSQNKTLNDIKTSSLPSLSKALWNYDNKQLEEQLKGIVAIADIVYVKIEDSSKELTIEYGRKEPSSYHTQEQLPLKVHNGQEDEVLGNFTLISTKEHIYDKMKIKLLNILLTQFLKSLLIAFIILMICRKIITKHLYRITDYLQKFDINQKESPDPIILDRTPDSRPDEMDDLCKDVNDLIDRVVDNNAKKDKRIDAAESEAEMQKALAINSAKLAALGEMAGGIAHEINNPLSIISTSTALIKRAQSNDKVTPELIAESVHRIESTIDRIVKIINGLRSVSRESSGQEEPFRLFDVFEDVLALSSEKLKSQGVEVKINFEDDQLKDLVIGDRVQVSQVFINLIGNSNDAIEELEEKWIKIDLSIDGEYQVIKLIDSGNGIPEEFQHKIFNPFYTSKEVGKGTGLGLSISKNIVEKWGGSLDLDTKAPNTTFVMKLKRFPS